MVGCDIEQSWGEYCAIMYKWLWTTVQLLLEAQSIKPVSIRGPVDRCRFQFCRLLCSLRPTALAQLNFQEIKTFYHLTLERFYMIELWWHGNEILKFVTIAIASGAATHPLRLRLIHTNDTAVNLATIQFLDSSTSILLVHSHKAETPCAPSRRIFW